MQSQSNGKPPVNPSPTDVNNFGNLGNFNVDDFAFGDLGADFNETFPMQFDEGSGYDGSLLDQPATTPSFLGAMNNTPSPFTHAPQELIPTQQTIGPSPIALTPNQALPTPPPGIAYHPLVGWYYPVPAPVAGFPPPLMMPPNFGPTTAIPAMPMPFANPPVPAYAPIAAPANPSSEEVESSTDDKKRKRSYVSHSRSSSRHKRKYGPGAYLAEQAQRRAEGDHSGPRPVSRDSVDYHTAYSKSAKPSQETMAKATPNPSAPKPARNNGNASGQMKELNAATVQRCRCPPAKSVAAAHIPRPRNAFIIFRNDFAARWPTSREKKRGQQNTQISSVAGKTWKGLTEKERDVYKRRAAEEAEQHKIMYPDYSYAPMKKIQSQFGQPSCTCGAYALNMAELERLRKGAPTPENKFTGPDVDTDNDEEVDHVASRTRSQSRGNIIQAPTSQMAPFSFGANMPDFGFSLEPQNAAATEEWAALQAFNAAHDEPEEPPAKRRSPRSGKKSVSYAEASESEHEVNFTTPRKHRPAPISTSRKPSSTQLSEINSADFFVFTYDDDEEGPAARTRSRSTAGIDEDLFGPEDIGENIVVASPKSNEASEKRQTRSSSRNKERQGS